MVRISRHPLQFVAPSGVADECTGKKFSPTEVPAGATEHGYKSFPSIAFTAQTAEKEVQVEYDNGPSCYAYQIIMK